ncbi:spondin-1-like isoform X2 [Cimex lectularius]|uniref:Spondin-1 n=1 Tax=Cimex lectularius TaxID=79782 RepID=A0A8I6RUM9_CIMLE|nr:spondin-1-like isoform X2 [Cimex lectularius]
MCVPGWAACLFIACLVSEISCECRIFPRDAKESRGNLNLQIKGNAEYFIPRTRYTVELNSKVPFDDFMIFVETDRDAGNFQLLNDGYTKFSDECLNTVQKSDIFSEATQVKAVWVSPMHGCHNLIGVVKIGGRWKYTNTSICAKVESQNDEKSCCPCDHAKYQFLFEGLWSPERHPKDFPRVLEFTHFSDLIGASHTPKFTMWREGGYSTPGMKQLAEFGVISEMEVELKRSGKHLKSLIKSAGLWYPNLNGNMTGTFRVDAKHHLVSLASMFGPSPDWIVGVSSLDLCSKQCTWKEKIELDLYPYDAGTDNGISYMSIKSASEPQERISKITSSYPDDQRSPFYDPEGKEMPSLAKLVITQEKIIPKLCSDLSENELLEEISITDNSEDGNRAECQVTEYSSWSSCSVTCGKGLRMRSRQYQNPDAALAADCKRQLISKEMCVGEPELCPGDEEDKLVFVPGECDVTTWSNWTECSVTCGIGSKLRKRQFKKADDSNFKKCSDIALMEVTKCMLPPCFANEKKNRRECSVNEWSLWSTCTKTCGKGEMIRVRSFVNSPAPSFCSSVTLKEVLPCIDNPECTIEKKDIQEICSSPAENGPCRATLMRWAYNKNKETCEKFIYGGCRGNRNNFLTLDECQNTCSEVRQPDSQPSGPKRNCVVSNWTSWSPCRPCVNGTKTKVRKIVKRPLNGGRKCPPLTKTISCNVPPEFCE